MLKDLKKIASQSIVYGFGTMAPKLAGLILIPLYTKQFPLREFGILGILDSSSQILVSILGLALYNGFFRWYFDKEVENRRKSLFFSLLLIHVSVALLSLVVLWPLAAKFSVILFNHAGYAYVIRVMIVTSLLQMVMVMPSTLLRAQEKAGLYTLANLVQTAVMLLLTLYLILWRKEGIEAIFKAQLAGLLVYLLMLSRYIFRNMDWKFERQLVAEVFKFCLPLLISSIAIVLLNQADRFIIKEFGLLADVGLYTLSFRLSNTLNIILVASISFSIQPLIFKKMDDPENKRFYSKLMTYLVLIIMLFVLGMTLYGKEIVKLFSRREEYYDAYKLFPLLNFTILLNMMRDIALIGLQINKKTGVIAVIIIIVSLFGIAANFALVPLLNNQGAALARFLASALYLGLIYYYSQRSYHIPYEIKKLALMIVTGFLLCMAGEIVNDMGLAVRLGVKSGLILIYPFILYLMGFFEPIELTRIKEGWKEWRNPSALFRNLKRLLKTDR